MNHWRKGIRLWIPHCKETEEKKTFEASLKSDPDRLSKWHPSPSLHFWLSLTPLVKISFSPQLSSAIKVKDDSHFSLTWYWAFNCSNDVCSAGHQKGLQRGMAISCQLYWTSPNKKQLEKLAVLIAAERNKTAERQGSNTYFSTY